MNDEQMTDGTSALAAMPQPLRTIPAATPTPVDLLSMVVARGGSLDEVQKFMDLADRWEAAQAKKAFISAMSAFKSEVIRITKDKANLQYGSKYASLGNIVETVTPHLSKHGLSIRWDQEQSKDGIKIIGIITHVQGHSERTEFIAPPDPSGQKNPIQQIKSTITYGRSVTFEALTGLASTDANLDDDGNSAGRRVSTTPEDFDLQGELDKIGKASTVAELTSVFNLAYAVAKKAGDRTAQDRLLEAQKLRQAQLRPVKSGKEVQK